MSKRVPVEGKYEKEYKRLIEKREVKERADSGFKRKRRRKK